MSRLKTIYSTVWIGIIITLLSLNLVSGAIHLAPAIRKSPNDISYQVGTTGNTLIWAFEAEESGDVPDSYNVTIDGTPLTGHIEQSWSDNQDIIVNVDGLDVGSHTVTIKVWDSGYPTDEADATTDSVTVTVVNEGDDASSESSTPPEDTSTGEAHTFLIGFVGITLIFVILLRKPVTRMK